MIQTVEMTPAMTKGKLGAMMLDRKTLLMAAEMAEQYDKCSLCARPLTDTDAHRLHRGAIAVQKITQCEIANQLRALAATAQDLKGRRLKTLIS